MRTTTQFIILLLMISISCSVIGQVLHSTSTSTYGDLLPPVGKWTNCKDLPETCDVPEMESNSLSDLAVYRFENGSMVVEYVGDAPIEK